MIRSQLFAFLLAATSGCASAVIGSADAAPPVDAHADVSPEIAGPCNTSADCPSGQMCTADPGCTPLHCAPAAHCSPPAGAMLCGCDGVSFPSYACPDRPFAYYGACASSDASTASDASAADVTFGHPTPVDCTMLDPTTLISPIALLEGQRLGVTADAPNTPSLCSARPTLWGNVSGFDMEACGPCRECACIDPGYEASVEVDAPSAGQYTITVGSQQRPLIVATNCAPVDAVSQPLNVAVVGPNTMSTRSDFALWWVHVTGEQNRCCGTAHVGGTVSTSSPNAYAVSLYDCTPDPCDCVGPVRPFEAWIDLGALASGHYTVAVDTASPVAFDVP